MPVEYCLHGDTFQTVCQRTSYLMGNIVFSAVIPEFCLILLINPVSITVCVMYNDILECISWAVLHLPASGQLLPF